MRTPLKAILSFALLSLSMSVFSWGEAVIPDTLDVVLDNNYPPYVFYDDSGELQGILVDEWSLFQEKTGIPVVLHAMDWGEALQGMEAGDYDVIDTIFINPEREKIYSFTQPYADLDVSIFFHKNITGINTIDSLRGFSVAAKKGDNAVSILEAAGIEDIRLYDSYEAIIQASAKNEVVIFVIDNPPARYFLYKYSLQEQFKNTEPLYTGQFHRAVQKMHPELIPLLEAGFSKISAAEHEKIMDKWFGKSDFYTHALSLYMIYFLSALGLLVLSLVIWNMTLRRSVFKKTVDLRSAIEELSYNESKLKAILDSMPDWVFVLDHNGIIIDFLTTSREDGLLVPPSSFIQHSISEFFSPEIVVLFYKALEEVLDTGRAAPVEYALDLDIRRHYESRYEKLSDDKALVIVRDMTERYMAEQKIRSLSLFDTHTGIYNRNYFETRLDHYRQTGLEGLSFLMVDFDGLKLVNDTLGHNTGDRYLKTVAELLSSTFKDSELVARIGGDEFIVILKDWTDDLIQTEKNKLKNKVDQINESEHMIPFSISVGYASYNAVNTTVEDILKAADDFMYREKLFHRQSMRSRNIDTLTTMLEERDFITQGHGERMIDLVVSLSRAMGLPESETEALTLFAQFHDIGKIGISDTILFKPDRLSAKEQTEMKRHSEIGYRIAESSMDLIYISEWIYKHHEWWDGSGYPFGLRGEDIPLPCRILALVDAYDAMTNDRPYRQAMTPEEALAEIKRQAGIQFDPGLIEPFLRILVQRKI